MVRDTWNRQAGLATHPRHATHDSQLLTPKGIRKLGSSGDFVPAAVEGPPQHGSKRPTQRRAFPNPNRLKDRELGSRDERVRFAPRTNGNDV